MDPLNEEIKNLEKTVELLEKEKIELNDLIYTEIPRTLGSE